MSDFQTSNYVFKIKLEFGIVTFDIHFHLALNRPGQSVIVT